MNAPKTRREFLTEVGRGMLVATVGYEIASDLGLAAGDYPLELGFHADFDFTIAAGREIWRATSDG